MNVRDCIAARVSTRSFNGREIPDRVIAQVLDAARLAPSPKNRQPWRFVILKGYEKDSLVRKCREGLNPQPGNPKYLMDGEYATEKQSLDIIDSAPVLILIFDAFPSEQALQSKNDFFDRSNILAIGAAIENMLLCAAEMGISSLWIGDLTSESAYISQRYFSEGKFISSIVLGYSDVMPAHASKKELSELIISERGAI